MRIQSCTWCCIGILVASLCSHARAADLARGKALFHTCATCHGAEGEGNQELGAPPLAGQHPWYVMTQLDNFQKGLRGAHPRDEAGLRMRPMARTLVGDDAADVVAFIATLAPRPPKDTLQGDPARGKTLFTPCLACHGPALEGNEALHAPRLKYLADWYLLAQLRKFKEGLRGTDPKDTFGAQMRAFAATLVDEQALHDVIAYIRSIAPRE